MHKKHLPTSFVVRTKKGCWHFDARTHRECNDPGYDLSGLTPKAEETRL